MMRLCASAIVVLAACNGPGPARVGEANLAQATGTYSPPEGQTVAITAGNTELPAQLDPVVRVAFDDDLTFGTVQKVLAELEARGSQVHILVGQRKNVAAMVLEDELEGPAIRLVAELGGKACVAPPGSIEAKCVQTAEKLNISRAYVRELTREAMMGYDLYDVEAFIPDQLDWANVVRLIDGARTCCIWDHDEDVTMRVALVDRPAPVTVPVPAE